MNVVYNCHIPEVMGYPEKGYCFSRGEDAFLMWGGYFYDLMQAMWTVYGRELDAERPDAPNLTQVPILAEWNTGNIGSSAPFLLSEPGKMAIAFREAVAALGRAQPHLEESPIHGVALAEFLEQAATAGQWVCLEEWWD
ncbi:MAG: hypothetical protein C0467_16050 [Planctomycetaceae bacterium]|nr:hypothetical protein [Planctomycetaceae bacterium]